MVCNIRPWHSTHLGHNSFVKTEYSSAIYESDMTARRKFGCRRLLLAQATTHLYVLGNRKATSERLARKTPVNK